MVNDLLELKKLTKSFIEQERKIKVGINRWKAILDAIPLPIFIMNDSGEIEFANSAMTKELKLPRYEIEGQHCHSIIGGFEHKSQCYCSNATKDEDFRKEDLVFNDSIYIHSRTPIKNDDGEVIGYICTLNNVTSLIKEYYEVQNMPPFIQEQASPSAV